MSHTAEIKGFGRVHYDGGWNGDIEFVQDRSHAAPVILPAEMVRAVARLMLADEIERAVREVADKIRSPVSS